MMIATGIGAFVLSTGWFAVLPSSISAIAATNCPMIGSPVASPASELPAVNDREATASDLAIIDSMLQQHTRAMTLANEALQYAQESQVRRMALRISEGHVGEMQLLRSWRSAWFPNASGATPLPSGSWNPESLGTSCSIQEFDRAFLVLLRAELQAEVAEARTAASNAEHSELRDFASSLIDIRLGEIGSIDSLLSN